MSGGFPIDAPAFEGISEVVKDLMPTLAVPRDLTAGEVLMTQGEQGETFYVIATGALEFSVISGEGRKLTLDVMHAGAMFGEIALFDPGPRTATVTALEPSRVWGIRNRDVITALHANPALAVEMLRLAGQRMRWMGAQLSEQVFLPLPARLAAKILHLTMHSDADQPTLAHSQAELAEFVGASREAVSKTLSRWAKDGTLTLTRGGLQVLRPEALEELADAHDL